MLKYIHEQRCRVPILLFHRVSDDPDPYWPPLTVQTFKRVIFFFQKQYEFRSIADLLKTDHKKLKRSCFIVFDDAYKDFQENVLPFLEQLKIPVTMFIPVKSVDSGKPIWTTWLNMCIQNSKQSILNINNGVNIIDYDISNSKGKIDTANKLTKWLKSLPYDQFNYHLEKITKQIGEDFSRKDIRVMTWSDITETSNYVDYQSHTMTHPMLGNIQENNSLSYEIGDSRMAIQQRCGIVTKYISYPIGSYSPAVIEKSKKYYEAGFAVDGRLVVLKKINDPVYRYRIPRFNVSDADPYELFFRVNGFHKIFRR